VLRAPVAVFLHHWHFQCVEENFAQLFGAAQVERLPGQGVGFLLQRCNALAQLLALHSQQGRINQHAVALYLEQYLAAGNF
jgi:hypothetical protein